MPTPTTITGLRAPGSKRFAAPGLPEIAISLGNIMELEFRWNPNKGIYYAIKKYGPTGEHVFAADPKTMHTEELWIEWVKLVADFLAGKGEKIRDADIQDVIASKFQSEKVIDNGFQEQAPTVGGPDDSNGPEQRADPGDIFIGDSSNADRPAPWQHTAAPATVESGSGKS